MDKQTKFLFDRWLQREYPNLNLKFTDTDSLHDAYLIVVNKTTKDNDYSSLVTRAYIAAHRFYIAYKMRYLLSDPLFWVYQAMSGDDEQLLTDEQILELQNKQQQEDKQRELRLNAFQQWVKNHYSINDYLIFRMFYYEKLQIWQIAKQTNKTKKEISLIINTMCQEYKTQKYKLKQVTCNTNKVSTSKHCSICFRISKNNKYQLIPSAICIDRLKLKQGTKLLFQHNNGKFFLILTELDTFTCTLHSGTRPYNLMAQNKEIVTDILQTVNAQHSVTLLLEEYKENVYLINTHTPLKID